jgi:hypothetical protein
LGDLLVGRAEWLGREDPTRWKAGDVRGLLDLAVTRLTGSCDLAADAIPALRAYFDFLGDTGRLHPASASLKTLAGGLNARTVAAFADGMADRSRFRMAKTFYTAMLAEGVDVQDDDAVDEWMLEFSSAGLTRRKMVLAHLWDAQPELRLAEFIAREGKVAAIALVSRRDARRSVLLAQVLTLAGWIGQGRKVTKEGFPVPADVRSLVVLLDLGSEWGSASELPQIPDLEEIFWLARQTELIDVRRDGLVAGRRLTGSAAEDLDDGSVLELWDDIFTLVEQGQSLPDRAHRRDDDSTAELVQMAGKTVPGIMVELYRAAGDGSGSRDLGLLLTHLKDAMAEAGSDISPEDVEFFGMILAAGIYDRIFRLADHGALDVVAPDPSALAGRPIGQVPRHMAAAILTALGQPVTAEFTALGRRHLNLALLAQEADAPARDAERVSLS